MDEKELEKYISKHVLKSPAPGKHCARSSLRHLQKARGISQIDPEMAVFRAITGEEESATAIFHALQRRGYKNSKNLKPRDHLQKNSVAPFLEAIKIFLKKTEPFKELLDLQIVHSKSQGRLVIRLKSFHPETKEECYAFPTPPLGFSLKQEGKIHDFKEELQEIAKLKESSSILKHLKVRANMRNIILYASSSGIPKITSSVSSHLEFFKGNIFRNLIVFLLIDQYSDRQLFAQQALNSFLVMVEKIPPNIVFE